MRTDLPPKRSAKLAVRNCQPIKGVTIFHVESGEHKCTSAEYTATMNKYGFLASVGRTGVCHVQRSSRIIQRHPCRKELVNQEDLPHQKKSSQRGDIMD